MGGSGRVLRASIGAILFASLVWFLFIGMLANQASSAKGATRISHTRNFNIFTLISSRRQYLPRGPNYNSVSKRRVPNGPDPIHNRRAGTSRVPPARA